MTWSKYGTEFWEEMAADELSDAAARTHGEVIGWLYNVDRPSCMVPKSKVYKVTNSPDNYAAVRELVRAKFWREHDTVFEVVHHADVIRASLAAQAAKKSRDAVAQQRRSARARSSSPDTGPVTGLDAGPETTQTDKQTDSREVGEPPHVPEQGSEPWPEVSPPGVSARDSWRTAAKGYDR